MAEWKNYELGSVCSRLSSGKNISAKQIYEEGEFPVYGGNGIRGFADRSNFAGDCAIIGRQGAYCGNVRYFSGEAYMTEHAVVVCANENNNTHYLAYVLSTMDLGRLSGQSAQPGLSVKTLSKEKILLPDIETQNRTVAVLASIDKYIGHNSRVNSALEKSIRLLFKEWFIDNPEAETWEKRPVSDIVVSTLGGDWGKETEVGNYTKKVYCIRGADIPEVRTGNKGKMPTRYILPKNYQSKRLVAGDMVIEISGGSPTQSTGRCALISQSLLDRYDQGMVCTNFCRALKPKIGFSMFLYYLWLFLYDEKVFFSYENGTTGIKNLDLNGFLNNETFQLPPEDILNQFNLICEPAFSLIFSNGLENEKMSFLRDTLLPRLVSGEIDVSSVIV